MKKSVETQLIDFLKSNPTWFASGDLQRKEWRNKNGTLATPRSIVRRLEENAEGENALLEVEYRANHAFYRIKQEHVKHRYEYREITLPDGKRMMREELIA